MQCAAEKALNSVYVYVCDTNAAVEHAITLGAPPRCFDFGGSATDTVDVKCDVNYIIGLYETKML